MQLNINTIIDVRSLLKLTKTNKINHIRQDHVTKFNLIIDYLLNNLGCKSGNRIQRQLLLLKLLKHIQLTLI